MAYSVEKTADSGQKVQVDGKKVIGRLFFPVPGV